MSLSRFIDVFAEPYWLILLLTPVLYGCLLVLRRTQQPTRDLTGAPGSVPLPATWRIFWLELLPWLRIGVLSLLILALARPAGGKRSVVSEKDAVDIALVLDTSSSMRQKDLAPGTTRIEVVRRFADALIEAREGDRVSLVTFARFAKVVAPLTFDRETIRKLVGRIHVVDLRVEDGTAIGVGLGTAVRRLRDSRSKSKVIVLLTDGENNIGKVAPQDAAELAKKHDIRVHTILAGSGRRVPNPFGASRVVEPGTADLEAIAKLTGGRFFRARSAEALARVGSEIDQMERTPVESMRIHVDEEYFRRAVVPAGIILLLILLMEAFFVRELP